jgi:hypothetical protein
MSIQGRFAVDLIAAYRASLDTGAAALDQSGNGRHGTLSSGVTRVSDGGSLAYSFAAATDQIDLGAVSPLQLQGDTVCTIAFWCKIPAHSGSHQAILTYAGTDGIGWYIARLTSGILLWDIYDGANYPRRASNSTVASGTWVHVVVCRDGTGGLDGHRMWLNGVEQTASTDRGLGTLGAVSYAGDTVRLGRGGAGTVSFRGQLDDILLWGRQLNTEEIADLYIGGRGAADADTEEYPTVVDAKTLVVSANTVSTTVSAAAGDQVYIWGRGGFNVTTPASGVTHLTSTGDVTLSRLYVFTASSTGPITVQIAWDTMTGYLASAAIVFVVRGVGNQLIAAKLSGAPNYDPGASWPYRLELGNPGAIPDRTLMVSLVAGGNYTKPKSVLEWDSIPSSELRLSSYDSYNGVQQNVWVYRKTTNSQTPGMLYADDEPAFGYPYDRVLLALTAPPPPETITLDALLPVAVTLDAEVSIQQPLLIDADLPVAVTLDADVEVAQPIAIDADLPVAVTLDADVEVEQPEPEYGARLAELRLHLARRGAHLSGKSLTACSDSLFSRLLRII